MANIVNNKDNNMVNKMASNLANNMDKTNSTNNQNLFHKKYSIQIL